MSSSKTPRRSARIAATRQNGSDESSFDSLIDDDSQESLYDDDDDDSDYEQEIGSDDSSVSSVASILYNDSLPSAASAEHKHGHRPTDNHSDDSSVSSADSIWEKEGMPSKGKPSSKSSDENENTTWHSQVNSTRPNFINTKEKFPENKTSSKNDKSPAKPCSSSKKAEDFSKQSPQQPKKAPRKSTGTDKASSSKCAKSTPYPRPPPSSSNPKSPIKKVRSSPPPTKEIYTKDQAKVVEDVLFASKSGPASYYEVLNLQTNASDNDIKKGYRKLALKIHPDKNRAPHASEAFVILNNAYDVLKSPTKKAAYDINITNDTSNSVPCPPPEQPSNYTSEYAPGTSIYNTLSIGTNVTLHLNGIKGYVVSFQQGQYVIKRNVGTGFIAADPLALLQHINVLSRDVHEKVKVVSYQSKRNRYKVKWRGSVFSLCLEQFIIPNGTVVHLVVNSPEYNGKFATIIGWTERSSNGADTSYYEVQLSLMKIIRVKMANVRL